MLFNLNYIIFSANFPYIFIHRNKQQTSSFSSKSSTRKNTFNSATSRKTKKQISYICGLRARIECEPGGEHSTRSDRITNIGYLLFRFSSVPLTETTLLLSLLDLASIQLQLHLSALEFCSYGYYQILRLQYHP